MEKMIVSSSPHIHAKTSTVSIMRDVLIALSPAAIASVVLFGLRALAILAVCVGFAVASEFVFNLLTKKEQTVSDLSAAVTGLILALSLPSTAKLWQCALGSIFAIVVVKCLFGGLGCNFANPAATARIFLLLSFASTLGGGAATVFASPDLVASATPLELIKFGNESALPSLVDMLIGNRSGALGETCALALIIGGIYLIARKVIYWHTPAIYVATVFALSLIIKQDLTLALYQVLGGGLLIGATSKKLSSKPSRFQSLKYHLPLSFFLRKQYIIKRLLLSSRRLGANKKADEKIVCFFRIMTCSSKSGKPPHHSMLISSLILYSSATCREG